MAVYDPPKDWSETEIVLEEYDPPKDWSETRIVLEEGDKTQSSTAISASAESESGVASVTQNSTAISASAESESGVASASAESEKIVAGGAYTPKKVERQLVTFDVIAPILIEEETGFESVVPLRLEEMVDFGVKAPLLSEEKKELYVRSGLRAEEKLSFDSGTPIKVGQSESRRVCAPLRNIDFVEKSVSYEVDKEKIKKLIAII